VETVVIPGETGYMSWNEQELLAGLKAILAETSGMRHKCLSLVKDNFNIEKAAAGYLNLFNREPSQEKKRFKAPLRYMDTKVVDRYDRQRFGSTKGRFVNSLEKRLIERAIQFASFSAGAKILDLPCGTGRISLLLAEKGFDITGGDISPGMVEKSRENADQLGLPGRTSFRPLDAENMDCPDDSFDAVVSLRFLGHTPPEARIRILQEFRRVAKRYIIVAYYRKSSLQEMARRRSRKKAGTPWYPVRLKDVDAEFTKVGIRRLKTFSLLKGVSETFLVIGEKAANNSFLPRLGGHGGKDFPVK
jgi:ubiquinone/menaquinone biosynthesis C-methylase UbiE